MGQGEGWDRSQILQIQEHGGGQWNYGLFSCLSGDKVHFCMGVFCYPCQSCQIAERMGKPGIRHLLFSCFGLCCIPPMTTRTHLRNEYGIEGSTCQDKAISCILPCCAQIQIANEIDS